ncbi:unnamed protein product [Rotaria sp. Silwood2]|nr:unnamed protein product [Rotaria sp. Silwood2]
MQTIISKVDGLTIFVFDGYFFSDGSEISSLNEEEIRLIVRRALALNIYQDVRVGQIIREESPTAYMSLSHEIAGFGISEREDAGILNACQRPLAKQTIEALQASLPPNVSCFLTRNAGTPLSSEDSICWPDFTFF